MSAQQAKFEYDYVSPRMGTSYRVLRLETSLSYDFSCPARKAAGQNLPSEIGLGEGEDYDEEMSDSGYEDDELLKSFVGPSSAGDLESGHQAIGESSCTYNKHMGEYVGLCCGFPKAGIAQISGKNAKFVEEATGAQISVCEDTSDATNTTVLVKVTHSAETTVRNGLALVEKVRKKCIRKSPYTHFISFPIGMGAENGSANLIAKKYEEFQEAVKKQEPNFNAQVFKNPSTLHFTLVMLKLYGSEAIQKCIKALKDIQRQVYDAVGTKCLVVELSGLGYMGDDPESVDVLYTHPKEKNFKQNDSSLGENPGLTRVFDVILRRFVTDGVVTVKELYRQRLLEPTATKIHINQHVTLCNTKIVNLQYDKKDKHRSNHEYNRNDGTDAKAKMSTQNQLMEENFGGNGPTKNKPNEKGKQKYHMNCANILRNFEEIVFGQSRIAELHLSTLAKTDSRTGYYPCLHKILLP